MVDRLTLVVAPLLYRGRTRAGWLTVAVLTGIVVATGLPLAYAATDHLGRSLAIFGLVALYAWVADGAWRLALARRHYVAVAADHLVVSCPPVLSEPLVLAAGDLDEFEVDPRPWNERRTAAATRTNVIAPPTFLDPRLPVACPAPSAHGEATAAAPNLVLRFRHPRRLPNAPASVRLLLRLSQGKSGSYAGPRPRREYDGLRLVIGDPATLAEVAGALDAWTPHDIEPRDERYLAPVLEQHHRAYRRRRVLMVLGVSAIVGIFVVLEIVARS